MKVLIQILRPIQLVMQLAVKILKTVQVKHVPFLWLLFVEVAIWMNGEETLILEQKMNIKVLMRQLCRLEMALKSM